MMMTMEDAATVAQQMQQPDAAEKHRNPSEHGIDSLKKTISCPSESYTTHAIEQNILWRDMFKNIRK
jgi:hypothetical protein